MPKKIPTLPKAVQTYLQQHKYVFTPVPHRTVFTAYDLAQTLKHPLERIAKVLLIRADKDFRLVVLSAKRRLDLAKVKKALKAKKISIAREQEMQKYFRVKAGAMTAFGTFHKVGVLLDRPISKEREALFPSGDFQIALALPLKHYMAVEVPVLADIGVANNVKLQMPKKKLKAKPGRKSTRRNASSVKSKKKGRR